MPIQQPAPTPSPAPVVAGAPQALPGLPQAPPRPLTGREVASLRMRRTELSNQLQSAEGRRDELVERLKGLEGPARTGIEQRIELLDSRILQIEADIAQTGRQLTLGLTTSTEPPRNFGGLPANAAAPLAGVFTLFVLAPLAFAAARLMWRRASRPAPAVAPELVERLTRIEQAVDAIAIETERVSEGQRFVTRLLTEGHELPALGSAQRAAEPILLRERVPSEQS